MKLLIVGNKQFYEMLAEPLNRLREKKYEEFKELETFFVDRPAEKPTAPEWKKALDSGLLEQTFICFCDKKLHTGLANFLGINNHRIPLFVLLENYDTREIDEVYQHPYLYTRGFFHQSTRDPEEVGHIIRAVKNNYRRHRERLGVRPIKPIGWKVQRNIEPGEASPPMISLFLDPVMREFMQRLLFVVESVNTGDLPKKDVGQCREAFYEIDAAQKKGEKFGEIEAAAKKLLARNKSATKPQPILLEGETGVGKTLIARKIHQLLGRRQHSKDLSFQQISTVNIGEKTLESELFGVIAGAWTDSVTRIGKLLLGTGGVIFLDEIGDLPPEIQAKFLVYLDTFEFEPDGWSYDWKIHAPAFIVAATNKNLRAAVERGDFRRDLYHRFTHKLSVPPLRARQNDIRALIDFVLQSPEINKKRQIEEISLAALTRLEEYSFPGNFRELEGVLSMAIFRARQDGRRVLLEEDLEF